MRRLASVLHCIDNVNLWVGNLAAYLVLGMVAALIYEVALRYVFESPTIWAHETAQMLYGVHFMLVGGFTLLYGAHVRMDVFYSRWCARTKAKVDSVTAILALFFLSIFLWQATMGAWHSFVIGEVSLSAWAPPIWIFRFFFPVGVLLILLQAIAKLILDINFAITGKELSP